jgi:hypothetical protein
MISTSHNFLFIHIPKTGGNSIQSLLAPYSDDQIAIEGPEHDGVERFNLRSPHGTFGKHARLREYRQAIAPDTYAKLFKFCVIRNPWDRLISYYFSPFRGIAQWDRQAFIDFVYQKKGVDHYIRSHPSIPLGVEMNAILRFEDLDAGFARVLNILGLPSMALPRRNTSTHRPYREYYDPELVALIAREYATEIETFKFQF